MVATETTAPAFQERYLANQSQHIDHQSVAIAFGEDPEGQQTEQDNNAQNSANSCGHGHIAYEHQCQIDEDADEPEPEMGEEVHHGIKDDARRGMLLVDVLRQFHDAVRFATQSTNRCGIVEGIARDGQSVDAPEADR